MKKLLVAALALSLLGCGSSREDFVRTSASAPPAIPAQVRNIFEKPVYSGAVWGLRVVDAESGEVLIDQEPDRQFFIGSVRKVFSVGLLLNEVGAQHTYDTPVFAQGTVDGQGVLDGSLFLVASGDLTMGGRSRPDGTLDVPNFDHNEANTLGNAILSELDPLAGYQELARQVAASGISRVSGDVVVDDRLFQPFLFRDEFFVTPIFVNDDVIDLSLTATTAGQAAILSVRPLSAAFLVVNNVLTGVAGSELDLEIEPEFPSDIGTPGASGEVLGSLPVDFEPPFTGEFPLVRTFRITQPTNYARTVFVEALEAQGVEVDADTVKPNPGGSLPPRDSYDPADRVALLTGSTYGETARFILKVSYNIGADTSLVLLGLARGVDNLNAALLQEEAILTSQYGIPAADFNFLDGSGGGETRATNKAVTDVLIQLLNSSQGQALFDALPILGIDGSLGFVTDFQSDSSLTGATGNVHAKTGTFVVAGEESALLVKGQGFGGYVRARSGRLLAYHLTVNEVPVNSIEELTQIFQDQGTISAVLWREF